MIHQTKKFSEFPYSILRSLVPEMYRTRNIRDFLENKKQIRETKGSLLMALFGLNRRSVVFLSSDAKYLENRSRGVLSDNSGMLKIGLERLVAQPHPENSSSLSNVEILYSPSRKKAWLYRYKRRG